MVTAALPELFFGVVEEHESMHAFADDGIDQVAQSRSLCDGVAPTMSSTIGRPGIWEKVHRVYPRRIVLVTNQDLFEFVSRRRTCEAWTTSD